MIAFTCDDFDYMILLIINIRFNAALIETFLNLNKSRCYNFKALISLHSMQIYALVFDITIVKQGKLMKLSIVLQTFLG